MAEAAAAAFSWVVQQGTKALMAVGFSKGTATAIASFATKAAVTTALSVAATAILTPRVGAEGGALALNDNLDAGIPYVAGRRAVAGVLQHADEFGADERYMGFINVKSGAGPVDAIESNRADSVAVTTDANGMVTSPEVFAGKMWLRDQLGQQPEIAHLTQPGLYQGAMMAGWSSTEKLSGKAAHILTLQQDSKFKSYPAGVPVFESTVRGIRWYDPRLDSTYPGGSGPCRFDDPSTWVYSTNGAIHGLGYALGLRENGQVVEGFGCPITDIVLEDYVEAANVADMNGWHCNAYWTSKDRPWQVYTAFLQAAGAVHVTKWGKLGCMPRGAARVSLTTISAADTAAAVSIQPLASRRDRINTITPKCPLESHQWAEPDLTPVKIQHYIDNEDGGEVRDRGVHYPFVTNEGNPQQAAQLAAYDILDSREGMTGVIPVRPYLMDLDPGDCFTVTEPGFNLAAQKFLVQKRSFDFETGVSILHLISETDGKHALALGQSSDAPDAPSLVAPDLTSVPAPGVSVWTAVAGTGDQPNLVVTGATDNATATHVRLEYRLTTPSGGGSWQDDDTGWVIYDDFPIETESITVTGLEPNTSYQVAVSYISAFGVPGTRRIIATLSTGTLTATDVGGLTRAEIDDALAFLSSADPLLAGGVGINQQAGYRNLITDPEFALGVGQVDSNVAVPELLDGSTRAVSVSADLDFEAEAEIVLVPDFAVRPGTRLMSACEVEVSGAATSAALRIQFLDADLTEIGAPVEVATVASGVRAAGFVEPEQIPAGAEWGRMTVAAVTGAAGILSLQVSQPLAAYAAPGDAVVPDYVNPHSEVVTRQLALAVTEAARAFQVDGLTYESILQRAAVTVLQEASASSARYQTSASYTGADGVDYALVELFAADGVSRILQLAGVLAFGNTDPQGSSIIAMEVRNQVVHILKELRLADDAAFTYYAGDPEILRICIGKHPVSGDVGVFIYDASGDPLLLINATQNSAEISPAAAQSGFGGVVRFVSLAGDHDLTTDSNPLEAADFIPLELNSSEFEAVGNTPIRIKGMWRLQAAFDACEWFTFRHRVVVEVVGPPSSDNHNGWRPGWKSFSANTGHIPAGMDDDDDPEWDILVDEAITLASPTTRTVRVRLEIEAVDRISNSTVCIVGGNPTAIRDSMKIVDAHYDVSQVRPGVFDYGT